MIHARREVSVVGKQNVKENPTKQSLLDSGQRPEAEQMMSKLFWSFTSDRLDLPWYQDRAGNNAHVTHDYDIREVVYIFFVLVGTRLCTFAPNIIAEFVSKLKVRAFRLTNPSDPGMILAQNNHFAAQ